MSSLRTDAQSSISAINANLSLTGTDWRVDYLRMLSLFSPPKPPGPLSSDEIKKRARLLVIDDEGSFPFDFFRRNGYSVDHWDRVDPEKLARLERWEYDLIFLDIAGVALEVSEEDGIGLLKHLKRKNPAQLIVAFSQHGFDLDVTHFFRLADDAVAKPGDKLRYKQVVDDLLEKRFSWENYWASLAGILRDNGVGESAIEKLRKKLLRVPRRGWGSMTTDGLVEALGVGAELAGKLLPIIKGFSQLLPE